MTYAISRNISTIHPGDEIRVAVYVPSEAISWSVWRRGQTAAPVHRRRYDAYKSWEGGNYLFSYDGPPLSGDYTLTVEVEAPYGYTTDQVVSFGTSARTNLTIVTSDVRYPIFPKVPLPLYVFRRIPKLELDVYSVLGGRVRGFSFVDVKPGVVEILWDGRNELGERVAAGTYYVGRARLWVTSDLLSVPVDKLVSFQPPRIPNPSDSQSASQDSQVAFDPRRSSGALLVLTVVGGLILLSGG